MRTQPTAERIGRDWAQLPEGCSGDTKPESQLLQDNCRQNGVGSDATKTVLVVGNSHSQQWLAAMEVLAEQHHWRLYSLLYGACPFMTEDPESEPGCNEFNSEVPATSGTIRRMPSSWWAQRLCRPCLTKD